MGAGVSLGGGSSSKSNLNRSAAMFRSASQLSLSRSSSSRRLKFLNFEKTNTDQTEDDFEEDDRTVRRVKPVLGRSITEVAVRGTSLQVDIASLGLGFGKTLTVESSHPFHVEVRYEDNKKKRPINVSLGKIIKFNLADNPVVFIDALRDAPRHIKITLAFNTKHSGIDDHTTNELTAVIRLGIMYLSLDVDADRDGIIERNSNFKNVWERGRENYGAVVITKYHTEAPQPSQPQTRQKISEAKKHRLRRNCSKMTQLLIRSRGPIPPRGWTLHVSFPNKSTRSFLYVYRRVPATDQSEQILGPGIVDLESTDIGFTDSRDLPLWVTGQSYTRDYSENVLHSNETFAIDMVLKYQGNEAYKDTVKCRLSPLIISPCTQPAVNVYVNGTNTQLLQTMGRISKEPKSFKVVNLALSEECSHPKNCMLMGYTDSPSLVLPLVLTRDSPQLTDNITRTLNQTDGDFQICLSQDKKTPFQRIIATPPIGSRYKLGCLLIADIGVDDRPSNGTYWIQQFLQCHRIQPIVTISTAWMENPDITSVVNFVPADKKLHQRGFKIVIPDTHTAYNILKHLQAGGLGNIPIFAGKHRDMQSATTTVNQILDNHEVWNDSFYFQQFIDQNKQLMITQLGVDHDDFIYIPMIWTRSERNSEKARPYMPNATNMIVLDSHIVIPRLCGPIVQGTDKFEDYVRQQIRFLTTQQRDIHCIDVWTDSIRSVDDDIVVQRHIPLPTKWWEITGRE